MSYRNNLLFFLTLTVISLFYCENPVVAQNNTSSPYSYYGLGELNQTVNGISTALGGTTLALRDPSGINTENPAALANLDSLKFVFNVGLTSKFTKINQTGESDVFHDNNISQLAFGFRVSPLVATSISLTPYTNVGYDINTIEAVTGSNNEFFQRALSGNGGLNRLVWSNGISITKDLSVGVNTVFLFGNNTTDEVVSLDRSTYIYISQEQLISQGIHVDFGVQYFKELNSKYVLGIGARFQPKQGVRSKRKKYVTNYQSRLGDTIYKNTLDRGTFDVPMTYGVGLGITKNKQLWIGADYLHEKWSKTEIFKKSNQFEDRDRFSVGLNYNANDGYATKFLKQLTYRFGAYYDTGYLKVNDKNIESRAVSFGLGIPLNRGKGMLNLSFEFGQTGTTRNDNVREDFGRFTLEMSLFERWFHKRKYR